MYQVLFLSMAPHRGQSYFPSYRTFQYHYQTQREQSDVNRQSGFQGEEICLPGIRKTLQIKAQQAM